VSSRALPFRPGVAAGGYPERRGERPPLSRALRSVVGWLRVPSRVRRARVDAFARRIDTCAAGLADLDDARFDAAVAELRAALRREGLVPAKICRGFALVREAARRELGTPHYDVQLYSGWVMAHQGLAELETGEGKTLAATLPAAIAALAGIPVHVVTANDYLVERDAETMGPLYARLGLTTGTVLEREPEPEARRAAYACDVTYVTNKQVAFDYLRDRLIGAGTRSLSRELGVGASHAPVMRGLCFAIVDEADSVLIDDARTPLILSRPGAPEDDATVRAALELARSLEADTHYRVDAGRFELELTDEGHALLASVADDEDPFTGERRRAEWVQRALCAEHLFERDRHYLVNDGAIEIIDQPTGRRAPDRAFEGGMHALIEMKEGLPLQPQRETIARISYQSFFRRYLRLAGMTGTAREVAREIWNVYGLRSVTVPTRLPSQRAYTRLKLLPDSDAAWTATVERVLELHRQRRPVLVGTATLEASERLSGMLELAGLPHQLLTARQDAEEAQVIARAGEPGRITVATRMAGRGTDIRLAPGVDESGGLAVVAAELSEAARIDRQLFGRCARQGSPGSCEQLVSLQDRLLETWLPARLRSALARWLGDGPAGRTLPPLLGLILTRTAQLAEESRGSRTRRRMLQSERKLEEMLAFSGPGE